MPQGKSRTRNEDLLGLFLSLVVSSARAVTIDPSTGVRGSLSRGVRIWINHEILFSGAPNLIIAPLLSFPRGGFA